MSKPHRLFQPYLSAITGVGLILIGWGVFRVISVLPTRPEILLLLFVLTFISGWFSVTIAVAESSITYHLGMIPAIAGAALFGPLIAAVLGGLSALALWLAKPSSGKLWRRSLPQLGFNVGMNTLATFCAGWVVLFLQQWSESFLPLNIVAPWLPAAIVYVLINTWLLIGVLILQAPQDSRPMELWREDRWSSLISIVVLTIGCGFLAYALRFFGVAGGLVFFLPILLSIYAFKLYEKQMSIHLDNLEGLIADRTQELESLNKQKDAFLTVLTHDMMTPLSSIRYSGEKIQADPALSVRTREYADLVARGQKTLHNIVSNILDIERVRLNSPLTTKREICMAQDLVAEAVDLLRPEADEKEIEIDVKLAQMPLWVDCDPHQIERVLFNLLSNALKYTPMGGRIEVKVENREDPLTGIISVEDTGYGIPEDMIETIFDKYMRVSGLQDKAMGTGIGLAITKHLVEEHGGSIEVKSKDGEGSCFTVRLPLVEA